MKRILFVLLALLLCVSLCACGDASPSGTYKDATGLTSYEFSGNTVKITALAAEVGEFEYEMDGEKVVIADYSIEMTYNEETDVITVGGISYTKAK